MTVTLRALVGTSISQGNPYPVEVRFENQDTIDQTVEVHLMLAPAGREAPVAFDGGQITVKAGSSRSLIRGPITSQCFAATGSFQITAMLDGAVGDTLVFDVTPPSVIPVTFRDVTAASGIQVDLVAFRNNGNGTFTDVAGPAGVERKYQAMGIPSVTWGMGFYDFNLDGLEDLYVAAGATGMMDFDPQPNELFVNKGSRPFLDLSALSGADDTHYGRAPVFADVNRDGLMDFFLVNQNDPDGVGHSIMYMNTTPTSGHWLEIDTIGTASNRDGCGALVTVRIASGTRSREMFCGSVGLASSNDSIVHFGLGKSTRVDRVTIRWPSGRTQALSDVAVDQLLVAVEPD